MQNTFFSFEIPYLQIVRVLNELCIGSYQIRIQPVRGGPIDQIRCDAADLDVWRWLQIVVDPHLLRRTLVRQLGDVLLEEIGQISVRLFGFLMVLPVSHGRLGSRL